MVRATIPLLSFGETMPEIWLPYGDVEVVLNLKAELLAQELRAEIGGADLSPVKEMEGRPGLVIIDENPYSLELLNVAMGAWGAKPSEVAVMGPPRLMKVLERRGFKRPTSGIVDIGIVDGRRILAPAEAAGGALVIAEVGFDVLYGYKGPWSALCDALGLRGEVWKRKEEKLTPGTEDGWSWFAEEVLKAFGGDAIAYIMGADGPYKIYVGDAMKAGESLKPHLMRKGLRPTRFLIVSAGGRPYDETLSGVLRAACNHQAILARDAELVVVGEARLGLGSKPLEMMFEGMPIPSDYIEGMEDLLCIELLKERGELHLVTALPEAMLKRLGLRAHRSVSKAFEEIEARHGWRLRATVIHHGALILTNPVKG